MAKKRANGEGSIRKKPNGRWEGRYTQGIDPSTGLQVDSKLRRKIQENKIAMGHKPDDHEEAQNQGGMVMGGM